MTVHLVEKLCTMPLTCQWLQTCMWLAAARVGVVRYIGLYFAREVVAAPGPGFC